MPKSALSADQDLYLILPARNPAVPEQLSACVALLVDELALDVLILWKGAVGYEAQVFVDSHCGLEIQAGAASEHFGKR